LHLHDALLGSANYFRVADYSGCPPCTAPNDRELRVVCSRTKFPALPNSFGDQQLTRTAHAGRIAGPVHAKLDHFRVARYPNSMEGVVKTVLQIDPWLALGVLASTGATDAVYVMFNAAVSARRRVPAATWSSVWYLLSAFAVISYTRNWIYVCFAAAGSWIGAYLSVTLLRGQGRVPP
jgi:hypothetical protein